MEPIPEVLEDPTVVFHFTNPDSLNPPLLSFDNVSFNYGTKTIFKDISFGLDMESRIAIVGSNGSGKTTLLKLMCGDLMPSKGYVFRHPRLRMARFSQHHVEQLDLSRTCVQEMEAHFPGKKEQDYRMFFFFCTIYMDIHMPLMTLNS